MPDLPYYIPMATQLTWDKCRVFIWVLEAELIVTYLATTTPGMVQGTYFIGYQTILEYCRTFFDKCITISAVILFYSSGKPSEKNLYSDIKSAWTALRTQYGVSPENILLYGQSIGTVPTVDLASRYEVAAVVLHSALMSGMRVAFPQTKRTWFFDAFPR